ncbi:MAG: alpha/beta hydrolase [Anaerolineaceae bacterium]|nr:alpha/beta hydrolase [Anaerolineaceae bacterium]
MPTFKANFFNFLLRHRHILNLRFKKEIITRDTSIPDLRKQHEKTNRFITKPPQGMSVEAVTIGGRKAEWLKPEKAPAHQVIFYTHGGGYVSGSCNDHRSIVAKFAKSININTLQFDYRLAPEHPFPAAVEDSIETYQWLLNQGYLPKNIVFAGESAGGGLCLATLVALRDKDLPLPSAAVAISPWTDLTCGGASYLSNAERCLSPLGSWQVFGAYYAGESERTHPWMSPLFADLNGLPPLYINAGGDEILRDDSVQFINKAVESGIHIQSRIEPGMVHCYPLLAPLFKEAALTMNEIRTFIHHYLPA